MRHEGVKCNGVPCAARRSMSDISANHADGLQPPARASSARSTASDTSFRENGQHHLLSAEQQAEMWLHISRMLRHSPKLTIVPLAMVRRKARRPTPDHHASRASIAACVASGVL